MWKLQTFLSKQLTATLTIITITITITSIQSQVDSNCWRKQMNCYYTCKTGFQLPKVKREYKKAAKKKKKKEERQSQIVEHSVELPSTGYYPPDSRRIAENVTKITSGFVFNATEKLLLRESWITQITPLNNAHYKYTRYRIVKLQISYKNHLQTLATKWDSMSFTVWIWFHTAPNTHGLV